MESITIHVLVAIFFFGCLELANSQENETCTRTREITSRQFLNVEEMLGLWYVHELYVGEAVDVVEPNFSCLSFNFFKNGSNPGNLFTEEIYWNMVTNQTDIIYSDIQVDPEDSAIWNITSRDSGYSTDWVWLQTDYLTWAVQYGCSIVSNYRYEIITLFTREKILPMPILDVMRFLTVGYGFPAEHIKLIDHANCTAV